MTFFFYSHGLVSSGGVGNNLRSLVDVQIVIKRGSLRFKYCKRQKCRSEMNVLCPFTQLCCLVIFFVCQYVIVSSQFTWILNWEVCIV